MPELEKPEADFDFFEASIVPPVNYVNSLMVTGNQIPITGNSIYPTQNVEERKNICWFDPNQDSEGINKTAIHLLSNAINN